MTDAAPALIGADALREALWICVEHNALHFGETHNTVVQGRAALAGAAPAAQGDARLWCVHIHGPDEVHAMPSRAAALERANELNEIFGQHPHEEGDPIMRAVVIEWPHSANAHKQDLADAARTAKHAADRAYQVHHASCSACQAAGKNSALQRCPQGRQLWAAAIDAARAAKEGSA